MSTFAEVRALDRVEGLYLLEIELLGTGAPVLYLAERELVVGGKRYESYLSDVKALGWCLGFAEAGGPADALGFRILNDPWREYPRLVEVGEDFPFEGASMSLSETYIGLDGGPTTPVMLFAGVVASPTAIDLMAFNIGARGLWPKGFIA